MALMKGLALESSKTDIQLFYEILEQDYAGKLGVIKNLTHFDCSNNHLTPLPESVGKMQNLTELYCSYNKLTSLPESIGKLGKLEELDCSRN